MAIASNPEPAPIDADAYLADQFCDEFEQRWRAGERSHLEEFVARATAAQRDRVFRDLLRVEIELRGRAGETPRCAEYLQRFPERTAVVNEAFERIEGTPTVGWKVSGDDTSPGPSPRPKRSEAAVSIPGYEILGELGRGGMGVVYKARQVSANRVVALKLIRSDKLLEMTEHERAEAIARFQTEARAAAGLEHDHLVTVYDVGAIEGQPYYSMRFVPGRSLMEIVRDGPLENRTAATYVESVARAVHAAHEKGILHRDLKPHNIMIDEPSNRALVADFGLAKLHDADVTATRAGDVLGSPPYMSPEQATSSATVTAAADVYGLGATLYHLLTGRPPFQAATAVQTLKQVLEREPISPRQLNPAVDRDLETICLKCLEKEPAKRYGTARALAEDLQRYLRREPIKARPVGRVERGWRWCRRNALVASLAGTALFLLIAGVIVASALALWATSEATRADERADDYFAEKEEADTQRGLAVVRAKEANDAKLESDQKREHIESMLYTNQIARAEQEWNLNNAAVARELLAKTDPKLRGWEYHYLYRLFNQSLRTFRASQTRVGSASVTTNGNLVIDSSPSKLSLWDTVSGKLLHTLTPNRERFYPESIVANGKQIVSAVQTKKEYTASDGEIIPAQYDVVVREIGRDRPLRRIRGHWGGVTGAVCSPDGTRIVTRSERSEFYLWDVETGQRIPSLFFRHTNNVPIISFRPDSKRVVTSIDDKTLRLSDAETGQFIRALRGHTRNLTGVSFSPDGKRIVTSSNDTTLILWDGETGRLLHTLRGHSKGVASVAFSPNGKRVISGGVENVGSDYAEVKVWNASNGAVIFTTRLHRLTVSCVSFSPDGRRIVTGSQDTTLKLCDAEDGHALRTFRGHTRAVTRVAFSGNGKRIVSEAADRTVKLWDPETAKVRIQAGEMWTSDGAVFRGDDDRIVGEGSRGVLKEWDSQTGRELRSLKLGKCRSFTLSADGKRIAAREDTGWVRLRSMPGPDGKEIPIPPGVLVTGPGPQILKVWDTETGKELQALRGNAGNILCISFSLDRKLIAAGFSEGFLKVWDIETGRLVESFECQIRCVAFSPDGRQIVTGNEDGTLDVLDEQKPKLLRTKRGDSTWVHCVTFSRDGKRIVSGCGNILTVWDARSGLELFTMRGHTDKVSCVSFSPDGKRIVSGSADGTLRIWDSTNGADRFILRGREGEISSVAFSRDGKRIVSRSSGGTIRVWDARSGKWPDDRPAKK